MAADNAGQRRIRQCNGRYGSGMSRVWLPRSSPAPRSANRPGRRGTRPRTWCCRGRAGWARASSPRPWPGSCATRNAPNRQAWMCWCGCGQLTPTRSSPRTRRPPHSWDSPVRPRRTRKQPRGHFWRGWRGPGGGGRWCWTTSPTLRRCGTGGPTAGPAAAGCWPPRAAMTPGSAAKAVPCSASTSTPARKPAPTYNAASPTPGTSPSTTPSTPRKSPGNSDTCPSPSATPPRT